MKINTIKELFGQIQIDADNQIIFNRELYEKEANRIISELLKKQKEICAGIYFVEQDDKLLKSVYEKIVNAPEPPGGIFGKIYFIMRGLL